MWLNCHLVYQRETVSWKYHIKAKNDPEHNATSTSNWTCFSSRTSRTKRGLQSVKKMWMLGDCWMSNFCREQWNPTKTYGPWIWSSTNMYSAAWLPWGCLSLVNEYQENGNTPWHFITVIFIAFKKTTEKTQIVASAFRSGFGVFVIAVHSFGQCLWKRSLFFRSWVTQYTLKLQPLKFFTLAPRSVVTLNQYPYLNIWNVVNIYVLILLSLPCVLTQSLYFRKLYGPREGQLGPFGFQSFPLVHLPHQGKETWVKQ